MFAQKTLGKYPILKLKTKITKKILRKKPKVLSNVSARVKNVLGSSEEHA